MQGSSFPEFNWYGTSRQAATAPDDGIWYTTRSGALISMKIFWWSDGFRMGMKSDLSVEIKSLDGKQAFPKISKA
ncbi:MAG: hypothetical protein ACI9SC_001482 [Gammaproteobacteria bacterium]|jgi:hypothetical protein